jgi:hypothetical protein
MRDASDIGKAHLTEAPGRVEFEPAVVEDAEVEVVAKVGD